MISTYTMRGVLLPLIFLFFYSVNAWSQKPVQKTNNMKVYMHYMPWFETPETIGRWGWHWTMQTKNPNKIVDGKREIAAHYYPLIGPYASRDHDVIEYHMLLMKLSGIDGVLINWYGTQGSNGDIQDLLTSSNAIVSQLDNYGMEFGVVLEDRFSRNIDDAKANVRYLKDNYFNNPAYIRRGDNQDPLLAVFGPITFQQPAQWADILAEAGEDVEFLTLWYESGDAGEVADGEYAWVYQDNNNHINHLQNFYANRTSQSKTLMGSAYPGFNDFYKEGGSGEGYFTIPHNGGATLDQTLAKLVEHESKIDLVQLVTWNDYGEGTIFEPTQETGFEYLKKVQTYTGVTYGEAELELVYKLYRLRKEHKNDEQIQQQLNLAAAHLANLEIAEAKSILEAFVLGLFEGSIQQQYHQLPFQLYPNPLKGQTLHLQFEQINSPTRLSISALSGKLIYSKAYPGGLSEIVLSMDKFKNGIYIVQLQSASSVGTQKVVISR
ncbi:hypothetical protein D770_00985 [Flammeovirgaceae bacterium 311]|nr:hypothetical protein D770_00985 [Flammeovirgaceae bacterium 311]